MHLTASRICGLHPSVINPESHRANALIILEKTEKEPTTLSTADDVSDSKI
jgi:hypothetical protein